VTRDQIRERLWPAGTFVDFEHSLNAAVKRLRAALADDAESPRFVETVPRRGYRFVACLSGEEPEPTSQRVRLAVLAFTNLSADRDRDYFSNGLTEEMTAQLGQLCGDQVGIISSHSAMHFRDSPLGEFPLAVREADRAGGRRNEALRTSELVADDHDADPISLAWLAYARACTDDPRGAGDLLEKLVHLRHERYVSPYHEAIVHAGLGDVESARDALGRAEADKDPMLANVSVDPRLSDLRADPRAVETVAPRA